MEIIGLVQLLRVLDDAFQIIYVDPLGNPLDAEQMTQLTNAILAALNSEADERYTIVDLGNTGTPQQRNHYDCGPFTVANLVALAEAHL